MDFAVLYLNLVLDPTNKIAFFSLSLNGVWLDFLS